VRSLRSLTTLVLVLVLAGCGTGTVEHGADHAPMHDDGSAMHDDGGAMHNDHADSPPIDDAPEIEVAASAMAFEPSSIELEAGSPVNVVLSSADIFHDLVLDEVDFHLGAEDQRTATGGLVIDRPGTYTAYCSVPGHRSAGMELELTVR
jgi:plastocyanin